MKRAAAQGGMEKKQKENRSEGRRVRTENVYYHCSTLEKLNSLQVTKRHGHA